MAGEFVHQSDEYFTLPGGGYTVPARPGEDAHEYRGDLGELVSGSVYYDLVVYPQVVAGVSGLLPTVMGLGLGVALIWVLKRRTLGVLRSTGDRSDYLIVTKEAHDDLGRQAVPDRRQAERAGQGGLKLGQPVDDWRSKLERKRERKKNG